MSEFDDLSYEDQAKVFEDAIKVQKLAVDYWMWKAKASKAELMYVNTQIEVDSTLSGYKNDNP